MRLAQTIRKHRDGILHAVRLAINQDRTEALNNKVRLITRRAYGFHSAKAALALVMLTCRPITVSPPHEPHQRTVLTYIDAERASFQKDSAKARAIGGSGSRCLADRPAVRLQPEVPLAEQRQVTPIEPVQQCRGGRVPAPLI